MADNDSSPDPIEQAFQNEFRSVIRNLGADGQSGHSRHKMRADLVPQNPSALRLGTRNQMVERVARPQTVSVLVVGVRSKQFALPLNSLRNIVEIDKIAPVPFAPAQVAGLINLRGRVVTVLDTHLCIGLKTSSFKTPSAGEKYTAVTVEVSNNEHFSLLIDKVGETLEVSTSLLKSPPKTLSPEVFAIAKGIIQTETDLIIMIDPERLIDSIAHSGQGTIQRIPNSFAESP